MDDDAGRRRRRTAYLRLLERRRDFRRRRSITMLSCVILTLFAVSSAVSDVAKADMSAGGETTGCRASMIWPLREIDVLRSFDGPAQPWLAGHRGVDLAAGEGEDLIAPADGSIAFSGSVAGKSVVTIRHGGIVSTFEPARGELSVGSTVRRGERFAVVSGHSDHCDGTCVHWGIRRGEDDYLDPQGLVSRRRVALKPVR